MMKHKCQACGLKVEKVPFFKEGECSAEKQHYFEVIKYE